MNDQLLNSNLFLYVLHLQRHSSPKGAGAALVSSCSIESCISEFGPWIPKVVFNRPITIQLVNRILKYDIIFSHLLFVNGPPLRDLRISSWEHDIYLLFLIQCLYLLVILPPLRPMPMQFRLSGGRGGRSAPRRRCRASRRWRRRRSHFDCRWVPQCTWHPSDVRDRCCR